VVQLLGGCILYLTKHKRKRHRKTAWRKILFLFGFANRHLKKIHTTNKKFPPVLVACVALRSFDHVPAQLVSDWPNGTAIDPSVKQRSGAIFDNERAGRR